MITKTVAMLLLALGLMGLGTLQMNSPAENQKLVADVKPWTGPREV